MTDMKNERLIYTTPDAIILAVEDVIVTSDIIYDENETTGINIFDHGEDM